MIAPMRVQRNADAVTGPLHAGIVAAVIERGELSGRGELQAGIDGGTRHSARWGSLPLGKSVRGPALPYCGQQLPGTRSTLLRHPRPEGGIRICMMGTLPPLQITYLAVRVSPAGEPQAAKPKWTT